ncbi:MAG: nitroreductase family protein, partial [bacterium]
MESSHQHTQMKSDLNNDPAVFEQIINRRRSNRKFDLNIKVPHEVIEDSLKRAVLSPNSSNMQLWEFYWIKSEEMKSTFHDLCLGQNAAKTADQLVVFVTRQDLWKKRARWNADMIKSAVVGEETKLQKQAIKY